MIKVNWFIFSFFIIYLTSCNGGNVKTRNKKEVITEYKQRWTSEKMKKEFDKDIKKIKNIRQFKFLVNNNDPLCFGFELVPDDQAIGVRNILLVENSAYLTDPYHGNIKKVNLLDGKVLISSILDSNYTSLRMLAYMNYKIYVFTDRVNTFIIDTSLKKTDEFLMSNYRWGKDVFYQKEDVIVLYRPIDDVTQLTDRRLKVSLLKLFDGNKLVKDSVFFDNYKSFRDIEPNDRGVKYEEVTEGSFRYLVNAWGKYELKEQLPVTSKYYDSKNIDFTANRIVYYSVSPKEVIITIYEY